MCYIISEGEVFFKLILMNIRKIHVCRQRFLCNFGGCDGVLFLCTIVWLACELIKDIYVLTLQIKRIHVLQQWVVFSVCTPLQETIALALDKAHVCDQRSLFSCFEKKDTIN